MAAFLGCLVLVGAHLGAEVSFRNLDLDAGTGLLFQARVDSPGYGTFTTGFRADTTEGTIEALSFFPEQATWIPARQEITLQNRLGAWRLPYPFTKAMPVATFPSFASGSPIRAGKLAASITSPDGVWLLYQRPTSDAWADLVLLNTANGSEKTIATKVDLSLDSPGASWSPESDIIIFAKDFDLYYYSITQARSGKVLDEKLRRIGPGSMHAVQWGIRNQLIYVHEDMVYEILGAELFTRSLYQDFLKIGRIIGRLPHDFDTNFDRFWMSPDASVLLLSKGNQHLYLYPMNEETQPDGYAWEFPFLSVPRSTSLRQVLWSGGGTVSILFDSPDREGTLRSLIYRLDLESQRPSFVRSESPWIRSITMVDEDALVLYRDSVALLGFQDWKQKARWDHPQALQAFPIGAGKLVVLGAWYAEQITIDSGERSFLFFTQSGELGYDAETGLVSQKSGPQSQSLTGGRWISRTPLSLRKPQTANTIQRVYTETLHAGPYENLIMIRKVKDVGTSVLFAAPPSTYEAMPGVEQPVDFAWFSHGSRTRGRQVALTFNAIDAAEGLDEVLGMLAHYGIKATFFVNGEFLRRYPAAARQLADSGQEVGNLFYTWFSMADQRYRLDKNFIKLGLARNEDEYREITGKELTLLWRTPYDVVNKDILDASKDLRYTLVGADIDSLDAVTRSSGGDNSLYQASGALVEQILARKQPGSIIGLTLGKPQDAGVLNLGRQDYVFQKLDVLINGLLQRGYTIVPVSALIEGAR